ncbi:hypothetical protein [Cuniculiplasma divulgatum]|jgi:hypothetical protein|uniref:Mva1269I/BsmI-group type IIS restriction endonuclease n=1 Tax=Cuniculiplasma divulgatum TaxID=1673428 RepID=A0A1R4A651_9ARCH|nr:hypothetical protein [Cuniculiplasma divulgatum]MCI2412778.1 hypothetical protein [Cuniculiplasma sp.]SJK84434.1 Mva1269I/BsmI-group type IIS restriction endonuclease [Cuniculiplasma divulgatum]
METKNLWILTEERPKREVIAKILYKFSKDHQISCFIDTIRILPILNEDRRFSFMYEIVGFHCNRVNKVFLRIVSGYSSFVDFLVFYQDDQPLETDSPIYAIEETKTDDAESRNTGVYQRASKFVYVNYFYPSIRKVMLYNLRITQKEFPTGTYVFGTRCLLTIGVEILGKDLPSGTFSPFRSVDELIEMKSSMRKAPTGNIPISIMKNVDEIRISGRLYKSGGLAHDPNIGALTLICATLRTLGWEKDIIITSHGLEQTHLKHDNKFVRIANILNIKLEGLKVPVSLKDWDYWKYENEGEKLGTIFIHLIVENFTNGGTIFENHAGSEKGYFITNKGEPIPLQKYVDREAYKKGDKDSIVSIPDLILIDFNRSEIINVEGKKYEFRIKAIEELKNFTPIEDLYIKKYYSDYRIIRSVVLYGGTATKVIEIEVGFLLNKYGDLLLGIRAPDLFKDAIKGLLDFWFNVN